MQAWLEIAQINQKNKPLYHSCFNSNYIGDLKANPTQASLPFCRKGGLGDCQGNPYFDIPIDSTILGKKKFLKNAWLMTFDKEEAKAQWV